MIKQKVYIAGPMRGYPDYNYPAFYRAEAGLLADGCEVVNPAKVGNAYGTPDQLVADKGLLDRLMNDELRMIATCDTIYLLKGWEASEGARNELAVALMLGLVIMLEGAE